MPVRGTVTIIAPDGTAGDVPNENVQAALSAGGKIGIGVYSPDGTLGYIPHDRLGEALKAGGTAYNPTQKNQPSPSPANIMQQAMDRISSVTPQDRAGHGNTVNALQDFGAGVYGTLTAPIAHPLQTAKAVGSTLAGALNPSGTFVQPELNPVGAAAQTAKEAGPLAAGSQLAGQAVGGAVLGELGAPVGEALKARMPEMRTSPITSQEMAARNVAGKALMSGGGAFDPIADALMREKGNVEQFAQQQGLSTRTPLEASRVTEQSKNALVDFYRNKMVAPAEDGSQIPVPQGSGVGQRAVNGSQYATISEIDSRIQELNNLTRPASKNALALDDATARAKMAALEAEKQSLTDILDQTVAKRLNLDPTVVQGVRQSMGARAQLADQMNLAANQASTATGKVEQMAGGPVHPSQAGVVSAALGKIVAKVTGGPEGQINRAFGKYYPKLDVPATIGNPATLEELGGSMLQAPVVPSTRVPIRAGSTEVQTFNPTPDQGLVQSRVNALTERLTTRAEAASANRARADQEFLRAHQLELGAQEAATGRNAVAESLRAQRANAELQARMNAKQAEIAAGQKLRQTGYERMRGK